MPTRAELSKKLRDEYERLGTWWNVSQELYDGKITTIVLSRIANKEDDYWPKEKSIRDLLMPPPGPEECVSRVLRLECTELELHWIQENFKQRARAEKLLESEK